jgi:hypothetical protein
LDKKDVVIGPFEGPPCKNFCVNPLVAIVQKTKIRPILNLKVPVGSAFNEAVDENRIRKLKMCSAKIFSQTLLKTGKFQILQVRYGRRIQTNPKSQKRLEIFRL